MLLTKSALVLERNHLVLIILRHFHLLIFLALLELVGHLLILEHWMGKVLGRTLRLDRLRIFHEVDSFLHLNLLLKEKPLHSL